MTKQLSTDEIVAQAMRRQDQLIGAAMLDNGELPQFKSAPPVTVTIAPTRYATETQWLPGTFTPAHDGEYEVLHPVTGMVERASYDTLFEAWSCEWQYPTWRGCTEQVS